MSEALAIIDVDSVERPKGVTKRQMRLAALLPRCETAAEALRLAGYSQNTINGNPGRQVGLVGVKRARAAIQESQADRARGLLAVGHAALATSTDDLKELAPRDRIAAGFKAVELAHALGENVEATGDARGWKYRQRRAIALAYYLGRRSVQRIPPPTTT